ncbi:aspartyl-tRNA synthetase [Nemania sp. NC0429]|nr:aspartyl-tRNA synthetase [Nemania sp. NC0429]
MLRKPPTSLLRNSSRRVIRCTAWSPLRSQPQLRFFSTPDPYHEPPSAEHKKLLAQLDVFKKSCKPYDVYLPQMDKTERYRHYPASWEPGQHLTLHGFLGKRRDKSAKLAFCDVQLNNTNHSAIQIVSSWEEKGSARHTAHLDLKSIRAYSPVCITGVLKEAKATAQADKTAISQSTPEKASRNYELELHSVECLNPFPQNIIVSKDTLWPPTSRHLQMRFDPLLYDRLRFRDEINELFRRGLRHQDFMEVETPVLFKSTPEGAREFLVPTRVRNHVYALPQSPQQYKQVLMASGVSKYFQFARCFRDEDHRADRQPEFTQLDLEMAFSTGADVMKTINTLISSLVHHISTNYEHTVIDGVSHLTRTTRAETTSPQSNPPDMDIKCISFEEAMTRYGIDKPDLRIGPLQASPIIDVTHWLSEPTTRMITKIDRPVMEACKFRFGASPGESLNFIRNFFSTLTNTPHSLASGNMPGVFVFDSAKPIQGLAAFGHEGAARFTGYSGEGWLPCEEGDVILIHGREDLPLHKLGGSTELGRLRKLIYDAAVEEGLLPKDHSYEFLWVNRFPLFSPNDEATNDEDPGQGGSAGLRATHHPFTAPLAAEDVDFLLANEPLKAKADHYDLVLNGVEIGGGSRRIHVAEVQEYIMRDILKMSPEGVQQFSHLLAALRAGCPPHAGFAFGFDRLISVLCGVPSVRDVIAFPKNNKGEDKFVGSPSETTALQRTTYHLRV